MRYITFNSLDQYRFDSPTGQWIPAASIAITYRTENALLIQGFNGIASDGFPLADIIFVTDGGTVESFTVRLNSPAMSALTDSTQFLYMRGETTYGVPFNGSLFRLGQDTWLNRDCIVSVAPSSYVSRENTPLSEIVYRIGDRTQVIFAPAAAVLELTNSDVVVEPQPATEFIHVNPLSLCYDITVVNHATGVTNTIHTPLVAADYSIQQDNYIVPFGGFMVVFSSNIPGPGTYIYFIDNDGNLVDQIVGGGPGYDWGRLDFRLVWAADNDPAGSVVKIFDGKNVRTYEFPYLAYFNFEMWSEGDLSKNLYIPFEVDNYDLEETYLYISTPGGGLIDLDYDSWYDNEDWSTIHPTSDKIFRCTNGPGGYDALEVYSEDGIKINSFNLASYNVNEYDNRDYYGANGDFQTVFYNFSDNTVPYLFVAYKAATNTFATFTSETAVNGYYIYDLDHETYDNNEGPGNVLTVVIGTGSGGTINGLTQYSAGTTFHWVPVNGTSWLSFENNNGDAFEFSVFGDGAYGTYPLFITTQDSIPGLAGENLYAILLGEESHALLSTGIATADAFSVNTSCLHNYTYARIEVTTLPANVIQWIVYSDEVVATASTSANTFLNTEGGTIVVLDGDDANNNWSWTTAGGLIAVPTTIDNFQIAGNNADGYWNPWGYSTNGHQVLIDRNGLNEVVGFYFLSENSTNWTYMPNSWDNGITANWSKGLNNFGFMTYSGDPVDGSYYYMNYDIATGAFISGGYATIPSGGFHYLENVGDRMSAVVDLPSGERGFNCFTGGGIVQVRMPAGGYEPAFNDAVWSED